MKKRKYKTKKQKRRIFITKGLLMSIGLVVVINYSIIGLQKIYDYLFTWDFAVAEVNSIRIEKPVEEYKYNDQIPVKVIKAEIIKQAKTYGNDEQFMLELAFCESGYNNLAENKKSSAEGVYQFLYGTFRETESGRNHISRFDYKKNIQEAMIAIKRGEKWRWRECVNKLK